MAFYKDYSKDKKKDHAALGSWDDEGAHYKTPAKGAYVHRTGKPAFARTDKRTAGTLADGEKQTPRFGPSSGTATKKPYDRHTSKPSNRTRPGGDKEGKPVYGHPVPRSDFRMQPNRPEGQKRAYGRPAPSREFTPGEPAYKRHEYKPSAPAPAPVPVKETSIDPLENLLSGRNPIREAIKSGRDIEKLLVAKGDLSGSAREIVALAKEARIPVQEVERIRLDEITKNHQGMLAFASAYQYASVDDMLSEAREKGEDPFLILLDGITDPHNLGAVIRTAECVGAHGVIVPERRSVGLTPAAVKASAGAVEHVKVARVGNLTRTMEDLKKEGLWIAAAVTDGESYQKADLTGPLAIVIGSEGEGIGRLVLSNCDRTVSLPLKGKIGSLNASVAAGILMYAVMNARDKS